MKKYFEIIKLNPLFRGIELAELEQMLCCVQGRVRSYSSGEIILLAGNPVDSIGLVLSGSVQIVKEDSEGKQSILTELQPGELFAEVFACAGITHSPVTAMASLDAEVLHLNYKRVITTCASSCVFHGRLIENMLTLVAQKSLRLNQKLDILSKRTTRERLMLFFEQYGKGESQLTVPYNREELAAYICVERSAMCAELSKMQREGLISYRRNSFKIL